MKLPKLPFLEKKTKTEYFLSILLRDEKVNVLVIEQHEGKMSIIGSHEELFPSPLEDLSAETLIQILDRAISAAEEVLPATIETQNTIFGVKDTWVEDKKITKAHLTTLKKLCDELSLTPMGFIVISEAIAHLIQKEEGAPLSALLVDIGKHTLTISLFRAGKLIEVHYGKTANDPVKIVDTMLKDFERVEILPSRIILLAPDSLAQMFIHHQWSKGLPFLHMPQVSILPSSFDEKAIAFGAATQLGFEFFGLSKNAKDIEIKTFEKNHVIDTESVVEHEQHELAEISESEEKSIPVIEDKHSGHHKKAPIDFDLRTVPADNFGFVVGQDIAAMPIKHTEKKHEEDKKDAMSDEESSVHHEPQRTNKKILPNFAALFSPLRAMHLPKIHIPGGNKVLIIPPIVLLFLIGLVLLYIFKLKATVSLMVAPKLVDETAKASFSSTGTNDFSSNIIAAKTISVTLDGTVNTNTTGQKEIGDKAKGTVTIYNSDDTSKSLKSGSTLTSSNGLAYTTDKDITIASASGDIFTGIKSGTDKVPVTAKNIGTEYNLPSNSKFSIEGSSVLAAKNESALSGGSKKKVSVVAKKDIDKLIDELPKSLEKKARDAMAQKAQAEETLIPEFTGKDLTNKKLDHELDTEAKQVSLTGKVTFTSLAYQKDAVIQFSQILLKNKYSQDQTIPGDSIATDVSNRKKKSDTETSTIISIKAGLLPKLDTAKITKEITGKSFEHAVQYIQTLPQVQQATIQLIPNLPILPKTLPRMSENITVEIKTGE